jgi:hypothetical protein
VGKLMARRKKTVRAVSPSAIEDLWQRRATAVAIERARAAVSGGAVPPMTPVGRLSDIELGWVAASAIFGWISVRAEQATSNGAGSNKYIHELDVEPNPWLAGAVSACLPELARVCDGIDWSVPLGELSQDEMISLLSNAFMLITKAIAARDKGERMVTRRAPDGTAPAEAQEDWDDGIPERYA